MTLVEHGWKMFIQEQHGKYSPNGQAYSRVDIGLPFSDIPARKLQETMEIPPKMSIY